MVYARPHAGRFRLPPSSWKGGQAWASSSLKEASLSYLVTLGCCWPVITSKLYFISWLKEDKRQHFILLSTWMSILSVQGWSVYIAWLLGSTGTQSFPVCVLVQTPLTLLYNSFLFSNFWSEISMWVFFMGKFLCLNINKTDCFFAVLRFWCSL